ncbi:hypothetical protein SABIM44S_02477 [Streptomyces abikoensis]
MCPVMPREGFLSPINANHDPRHVVIYAVCT